VKQFVVQLFAPVAVFLLISCPQAAVQNPYEDLKPDTFWAQNLTNNNYYTVESVRLAEGEKCIVWAEKSAGISVATGKAIAREYDTTIYPIVVGAFGSEEIMATAN
jgi:hypothetical protein